MLQFLNKFISLRKMGENALNWSGRRCITGLWLLLTSGCLRSGVQGYCCWHCMSGFISILMAISWGRHENPGALRLEQFLFATSSRLTGDDENKMEKDERWKDVISNAASG